MYKKVFNRVDKLIYLFLYVSLLIDIISGAISFFLDSSFSIGQFIKIAILFILLLRLFFKKENAVIFVFLSIYFLFIFGKTCFNFFTYYNPSILTDIFYSIKPLFLTLFYFWLKEQKRNSFINNTMIDKLITFNIYVVIINQVIGIMGFGYYSYSFGSDATLGTTGFFFSGNEYAILLLMLFSLKLFFIFKNKNFKLYLLWLLILLTLAITTAIKTVIVGTFLVAILIPTSLKIGNLFKLTVTIFIGFIVYLTQISTLNLNFALIERLLWIYDNKGLVSLLISGRDDFLIKGLDLFINKYSTIEQLIGIGYFRLNEIAVHPEMDFFDVLFMFGFIGLIIVYVPFLVIVISKIKPLKRSSNFRYVTLLSILIALISFFVGHLMFSVAAAPFIALILTLNYKINENIINIEHVSR